MKRLLQHSAAALLLASPLLNVAHSAPASEAAAPYTSTVIQASEQRDSWLNAHSSAMPQTDTGYTASLKAHTSAGGFNLYFIFTILLLAVTSRAVRH